MPLHTTNMTHFDGELRVTGHLVQHAELRMTPGEKPHGLLMLTVDTGCGLPYDVRQDVGSSHAELIAAKAKESRLRAGDRVLVTARGLRVRTDHGLAKLQLMDVMDVMPLHIPHYGAEPARERAA